MARTLRQWLSKGIETVLVLVAVLVAVPCMVLISKRRTELIWGPQPIINNKYWSNAMREAGWKSKTLMSGHYAINKRSDFDLYFDDLVPRWVWPPLLRRALAPYVALLYVVRNASVIHIPFSGGPLGRTPLWRLEASLLRWAGIRVVVIAYGSDAYMYSRVPDPSLRHALLWSYPGAAREEGRIAARVGYWTRHADVVLSGTQIEGIGRWDVTMPNWIFIDTRAWHPSEKYSQHNGWDGPVKVIHTPNHRGFKGTEFLVHAVEELRAEGLQIELVLLEKVSNDTVREVMATADILAEQLIIGYGMSALEGMASGLTVLSNLDNEMTFRIYRRYSFLNECPIVSTSPENIKRNLRVLVTNPELRLQLGIAGREYVEKYHSFAAAQHLFGMIYQRILDGRQVDLMSLFHPLTSSSTRPVIRHPLIESQIPERYWRTESSSQAPAR